MTGNRHSVISLLFGELGLSMPKILIADDSELVRKMLVAILSEQEGWTVCGQATNGQQAVLMAHKLAPDLIIMDIAIPIVDGLHATVEILKGNPSLPIILYTVHQNNQIQLEGNKAGARAVISKTDPTENLIATIQELLEKSPSAPLPEIVEPEPPTQRDATLKEGEESN
jgi:DNA-binding NarL/FixJ family response regulator